VADGVPHVARQLSFTSLRGCCPIRLRLKSATSESQRGLAWAQSLFSISSHALSWRGEKSPPWPKHSYLATSVFLEQMQLFAVLFHVGGAGATSKPKLARFTVPPCENGPVEREGRDQIDPAAPTPHKTHSAAHRGPRPVSFYRSRAQ
jgi:hypothetical protein